MTELSEPPWRKSSFSGGGAEDCVEVASLAPRMIAVRDSKNPTGPRLHFAREQWAAFTGKIKRDVRATT
jgi:hypothetical protein